MHTLYLLTWVWNSCKHTQLSASVEHHLSNWIESMWHSGDLSNWITAPQKEKCWQILMKTISHKKATDPFVGRYARRRGLTLRILLPVNHNTQVCKACWRVRPSMLMLITGHQSGRISSVFTLVSQRCHLSLQQVGKDTLPACAQSYKLRGPHCTNP